MVLEMGLLIFLINTSEITLSEAEFKYKNYNAFGLCSSSLIAAEEHSVTKGSSFILLRCHISCTCDESSSSPSFSLASVFAENSRLTNVSYSRLFPSKILVFVRLHSPCP